MAGAEAVQEVLELADDPHRVHRSPDDHAVAVVVSLLQLLIAVLEGAADLHLALFPLAGTEITGVAVGDLHAHRVDELDLRPRLLGGEQGLLHQNVAALVPAPERNTEYLHVILSSSIVNSDTTQ